MISSQTGFSSVLSSVAEIVYESAKFPSALTATLLPAAPSGVAVIGPHPHNVPVAFVPPAPPAAAVPSDPPVRLTVPKLL